MRAFVVAALALALCSCSLDLYSVHPELKAMDDEMKRSNEKLDRDVAQLNAEKKVLAEACKRIVMPPLGTTPDAAIAAVQPCWGRPKINRTTLAGHVHDQAVFYGGGRYLYFDDGRLTSIQCVADQGCPTARL
jgi:hypothetical protein